MAKVRSREDALLDAYLGRYKSAQASTVSEGQNKTKSAQQKGSALLNATDKTLPALKNTYSDTLQNIVSGASMENSLNNDVMQRSMNLAKSKFDAANDLYEQQKKAQEYAEKQAAKAAAAAAKSSGKKSSGSSSKSSTTSAADDTTAADALNKLGIGSNTTSKAKAGSGTTSKPSSSKTDSKKKEKSVNPLTKALQDKQAAANSGANRGKTTGKSYAEQNNAQKVSTQSAAAARQARQLEDSGRVFTKDGQINSRYKELEGSSKDKRSVGSRAADLVKGAAKQAAGALGTAFLAPTSGGSKENKQAQYKMRQMMDNGTVFTADGGINPDYQKAVSDFDSTKDKQDVLSEQFVPTLGLIREGQNQIAQGGEGLTGAGKGLYDASAMFANMVPGMALGVANPALGAAYMGATAAGNKIAEQTEKGRGSRDATLRGAASGLIEAGTNALPIGEFAKTVKTGSPILQSALKEGIENAGQEAASYLLNTAADYALKDPDANFSLQDMAGQVGMGAATGAAFGALGGALGKAFGRADAGNERAGNARPYEDAATLAETQNVPEAVQSVPALQQEIPALQQEAAVPQQNAPEALPNLQQVAPKPGEALQNQQQDPGLISGFLNLEPNAHRPYVDDTPVDLSHSQTIEEYVQSRAKQQADAAQTASVPDSGTAGVPDSGTQTMNVPVTNRGTAYMPDNTPVNYTWKVVDANDLVASNDVLGAANPDYPMEYQNRNRDSAASTQQITRMSNNLNPARLADNANVGDGAPVVRGDGVVISGNGRTAAIQSAYQNGKADNYRQFVQENAQRYGIDPATLPENPVLVRVADDSTDFMKLAHGANESTTASFGAAENAVNYSQKALNSKALDRYNPDKSISDPSNRSAIASLLREIVPESEYNRMIKSDGNISLDGYKTVKDTLFAAAYGDNERLQMLAEGGDDSSRNITAAMQDSAINAVTLRRMVQSGDLPPEFDVTSDISGAADLYAYVKGGTIGKGIGVQDYIEKLTLGDDGRYYDGMDPVPYSNMSIYIAKIMEDTRRSGKQTTEFLNDLCDSAKQGAGGEMTLEGLTNVRTRQDVIDDATRRFYSAPERKGIGKDAPSVPFAGENWANSVVDNRANRETTVGGGQSSAQEGLNVPSVQNPIADTAAQSAPSSAVTQNVPTADNPASVPALDNQTQSVSEAVPAVEQRLLNGSESVPGNAVGAESTQYNRSEVLNQDIANQRVMSGNMSGEEAAQLGIGRQTHTVYSRAEGHDTAMQDFDLLVQQQGGVTNAARTVADELTQATNTDKWDAENVYKGYYAAEQLHQRLSELDPNSAEAAVVKAQIQRINGAVSAGQSKAGQTLVSGRWAQPDEYMALRKLDQYNRDAVDRFARTAEGRGMHEVAQDVADTFNGPMDDEFTAFVQSQGVNTGDGVRDQMEYLAGQIQRMGQAHNVDINEEQARAAAASVQAGGTIEDIYGAFARRALGLDDVSQEDFDYAVNTFAQIRDMPDSRERYDLEMSVYNRMANYMPARGFADRLNNIRYLCMLGNTRTHIRNIMGNVMMGTVARAKDNVAGVMQLALPQDQRTKAVGTTLTADGRQMVQRARDYADNNMYSVLFQDGRWNMDTGLQAARNTFTTAPGRVIGWLSNINGNALEAEDNFFLRSEFGNSMASFLKARGYDSSIFDATDAHSRTVIQQAAAQALADAREATAHEDNFLSTAFQNLSRDVRNHGPAGTLAHMVIEGVLPFKKTPINIAKNALEYNAIGGTVEAIYRGATGQGAARVMDAAAKGVTGTAIMGAGYMLAKNGLLTGGASGDDRADAYKSMTGEQNYAVKIPGKGTYTLDWASPASVPLLIGAEIANDNTDLTVGQVLDKVRHLSQPVLETTMLQGLNDTLDSISYADSNDKLATLGISAVGSYANQFIPTALGQVARAADDTRRSTYGGGDTKTERDIGYNLNKIESKIPGLSQNLEPYVDQWGREQASLDGTDNSAGGVFLRGLYNMGSPGYYSADNVTPVDEYLQGLYDSTNDSKVLPEKASSKLTLDKETYYMTPQEKTEYAKTTGQTAYDLVDSLRQNDMFLQLPDDQQAELVQSAYTVAKTAGGVAAVGDGVSGVDSNAYKAYEQGGVDGVTDYLLAKNAVSTAKSESGDDSFKDVEKWDAIQSKMGDGAIDQYVTMTDDDSLVRRIYDNAGGSAAAAYMNAYSAASAGLEEDETPSKYDVGIGMMRQGVRGDDLARAYISAYQKTDKAGTALYGQYGADGLEGWIMYKAAAYNVDKSGNNNGKIDKDEAIAALNAMDLTDELRRAYLTKTNKSWKNPY